MPDNDNPIEGDLIRAVEQLAAAFAASSIRYALIGGLAATLRGRPRFTEDADFLLEVPQIQLPVLLSDLTERGFALDETTVIREFVREHLTSFHFGTVKIDWLKPVLPVYSRALADASEVIWSDGIAVRVATAEGLILTKMVAFRPQDQADIVSLLAANRHTIDLDLIRNEWAPFADTEADRTEWLERVIAQNVPQRV